MLIRNGRAADFKACLRIDHSISSEYAWRMEETESEGAITVTFQPIRLPRKVELAYPRQGEELVLGWQSCDLFLVASGGQRIHGYLAARSIPGHGLTWIHDLVVDAGERRAGIGTQLLREAAAWSREKGLKRLVIEVQTRNHPGVCFCRAMGLSFSGYHDHHWPTQDIALLFGLSLR